MTPKPQGLSERVIWYSYPSWRQFIWLYFFAVWTAMRGLLLRRMDVAGWEMWMGGAAILIGIAVVLRYWVQYLVTSQRVVLKNGYSGADVESMTMQTIKSVEIKQGPIAAILGIGTVEIQEKETDRILRIRGITNPDVPLAKINALLPSSQGILRGVNQES